MSKRSKELIEAGLLGLGIGAGHAMVSGISTKPYKALLRRVESHIRNGKAIEPGGLLHTQIQALLSGKEGGHE